MDGFAIVDSLRQRVRRRDLVALAAVPLVLLAVFALPSAVRRRLVFDYASPTAVSAYAAPFVHLEASHLAINLLGWCTVVPVVYALSVLSGTRRRFWTAFGTFVVVFPPILSVLNLAVFRPAVGLGFSGVVLAFLGYLPLALADFAAEHFEAGPRETVSPTIFFLGLALIGVLSVRSVVPDNRTVLLGTGLLVAATLLSAALYYLATVRGGGAFLHLRRAALRPGYFELFLVAAGLFVAVQFAAFPGDPVVGSGVVNLYAHLLGYALGFVATYTTVQVGAALPGSATSI